MKVLTLFFLSFYLSSQKHREAGKFLKDQRWIVCVEGGKILSEKVEDVRAKDYASGEN